jgi:hypothetical protein
VSGAEVYTDADDRTRYLIDGRPISSVTHTLRCVGYTEPFDSRMLIYAERGRMIHRALELYDKKQLMMDELDPSLAGAIHGYQMFMDDTGFIPLYLEHPLVSERWRFGGRVDRIGFIPPHTISIVDFKSATRARRLGRVTGLQTAGYEILARDVLFDEPAFDAVMIGAGGYAFAQGKGPYLVERFGLSLDIDGNYKLTPFREPMDVLRFREALNVCHCKGALRNEIRYHSYDDADRPDDLGEGFEPAA